MKQYKPIGIFDSGIGGLSIGCAIRSALPKENLMYFADVKFSPYGVRSQSTIQQRSEYIVNFLINQGCKVIVVACNTATVSTISYLRERFSVPIIGVEPGIKPAALQSKTGVIGVLATERTLVSDSFQLLKARYAKTVRVESMACPKFVSLVENLSHNSEEAMHVAEQYIRPLLLKGSDQIILGCTHFSFLRSTINKVVGAEADVVDTANSVAIEVHRRLHHLNLLNKINLHGKAQFWTSENATNIVASISDLWGQDIRVSEVRL